MGEANIGKFGYQVMRAAALLFRAHPRPIDILTTDLVLDSDGDLDTRGEQFAAGTLRWIVENGIVAGKPVLGAKPASVNGAQLTARALGILMRSEPNLGGQKLGDAAERLLSEHNDRDAEAVATLLMERLTD